MNRGLRATRNRGKVSFTPALPLHPQRASIEEHGKEDHPQQDEIGEDFVHDFKHADLVG